MDNIRLALNACVTHNPSGFRGVVIGAAVYIGGREMWLVQGPCGPDGRYQEAQWFDVETITVNPVSDAAEPIEF